MPEYISLGGGFWKSDTDVYCERQKLPLDAKKTKVYFGAWAIDGKKVYHGWYQRRAVDVATFVPLNSMYGKDAKNCYVENLTVSKAIPNADPASFVVLDSGEEHWMGPLGTNLGSGYAKDNAQVYFNGNAIKQADAATFVSLGGRYGRDANHVYFQQYRLDKCVPLRWRYPGGRYSRDDNRAYWEHKQIKNARLTHLRQVEPFDSEYAYDGQHFYYRGVPCPVDDYVDQLRRTADSLKDHSKRVASGRWQEVMRGHERGSAAPDETLSYFESVELGTSLQSIEAKLGPGTQIATAEWEEHFDFDKQLTKALKIMGTVSSSGAMRPGPSDRQVRSWPHPAQILVCMFDAGLVSALIIERAGILATQEETEEPDEPAAE